MAIQLEDELVRGVNAKGERLFLTVAVEEVDRAKAGGRERFALYRRVHASIHVNFGIGHTKILNKLLSTSFGESHEGVLSGHRR